MLEKLLIDVRTPSEFRPYHKDGAVNIPIEDIMSGELGIIANMAKDIRIECYCLSGSRAEVAKNVLNQFGYTNVVNLGGLY
jgi:rhodanese-related sulfurtransferase